MTAAEVRYAFLDRLPERLFRPTIANVHGRVVERGEAIVAIREALLSGRLPARDELRWPAEPAIRHTLLDALRDANVAPCCDGDPDITDDVVLFILQVVGDAHHFYDRALIAFHTLARKGPDRIVSFKPPGEGQACDVEADELGRAVGTIDWDRARADAVKLMTTMLRTRTLDAWKARVAALRELGGIFGELEQCLGLPAGTGRGMLRSLPRDDVIEMQAALRHIPALRGLIRVLGRMHKSDDPDGETALEQIGCAVQRVVDVEREVRGDRGVEIRGIERSGDIARMLPSEAAVLSNATLRTLWRARLAERALLTYHAPGVLTQRVREKQTFEDGVRIAHVRAERGPIVIIIDTSGSMQGTPERIAKAIVLQLLAVAFMEQRSCYVYNFSGAGDLVENELSFGDEGLMTMLAFISCSFYGGTEPAEALRRACQRLEEERWRQSDVVFLSDAHFRLGSDTLKLIDRTRERSAARFHGVRTGGGNGFKLLDCDSMHDVVDWIQPSLI